MSDKAWGGRFEEELDAVAARVNASVDVDQRLGPEDVRGSIAHVRMLAARGIVSAEDAKKIEEGLARIGGEIERGEMTWRADREDVHMNVEALLTERIGEAGGRLHTARSRNDQVATDMRLWTRSACARTASKIDRLVAVLSVRAAGTIDVVMPGYTHLQRAQPVRLAHHLLAWCEMLERDRGRLEDAAKRMNEAPLGAAALAGTTFPLDRHQTARELGFERPMRNSIDAVSDRDFLLESLSALSICAVHLSRISEELVLWSAQEFAFVEMSDRFTTGSSIMPQKKNPDMAELVRGKSGRVIGDLVSLLVLMKGLPLAYNRDMQEDKRPAFDAFDTIDDSLDVLAGALATARFKSERMRAALVEGFVEATEIADWLAAHGVPFREAHHVAGRLVKRCVDAGKTLPQLTLDEYRAEHPSFDESIFVAIEAETAIERRDVLGGPARKQVSTQIAALRERLSARGVDVAKESAALGAIEGAR
ncbi:argininosuccinate lyase [Sandaracinus amylolyticus]|uniref:argininosuccinate lyase n=1 Tax=Sandaracinus amylolyticus TaxID=927083 RepID=UPI001F02BD4B|nr:argininosuccinate lyase [Sandaracinus amylolyticus]UJR81074.1 Argininosuccinate lyase [Sandaracinus amylolyticus]